MLRPQIDLALEPGRTVLQAARRRGHVRRRIIDGCPDDRTRASSVSSNFVCVSLNGLGEKFTSREGRNVADLFLLIWFYLVGLLSNALEEVAEILSISNGGHTAQFFNSRFTNTEKNVVHQLYNYPFIRFELSVINELKNLYEVPST